MEKETLEKLKQALEKEKGVLQKDLESFASQDPAMKGNWNANFPSKERGSMEEEADQTQEYENLLSLEQTLEVKLKDANAALEKIERGAYGKCEKCGKEIEVERLEVNPAARVCVACNAQ